MITSQLSFAYSSIPSSFSRGINGHSSSNISKPFKICTAIHARKTSTTVNAATATVVPQSTKLKPLGNRLLIKIQPPEERTPNGIFVLSNLQNKPQVGEVVALGDGNVPEKKEESGSIKIGAKVVYSKYAGTEVEFDESDHLILQENDIIGLLETDDIRDLKPLNDLILVKVLAAEEKTSVGLFLANNTKQKSSTGTVIAVGPGLSSKNSVAETTDAIVEEKPSKETSDEKLHTEDTNKKPPSENSKKKAFDIIPGSKVLFSKYTGSEFKTGFQTSYHGCYKLTSKARMYGSGDRRFLVVSCMMIELYEVLMRFVITKPWSKGVLSCLEVPALITDFIL